MIAQYVLMVLSGVVFGGCVGVAIGRTRAYLPVLQPGEPVQFRNRHGFRVRELVVAQYSADLEGVEVKLNTPEGDREGWRL